MNYNLQAEQMRKALIMFAQSLTDEKALEIPTMYPYYKVGYAYKIDEMFSYGTNDVGDPQLYRVVQNHVSQEDWKPNETASLYTPIGLNADGYPVWAQPTGAHDAYNTGDVVDYKGVLYESEVDGNTWAPDVYGWVVI